MTSQSAKLLEDALSLPESDRADLAAQLIDSLDPGSDPDAEAAWAEEIKRRIDEIDSGTVKPIPWDEARPKMFRRRNGAPDA